MSRYNYVADVFAELGQSMGMPPLVLDDTDRVSLVFDGVLVTFAYTSEPVELVWLYIDLGEVADDDVPVLQRLLQLGFDCWTRSVMTIGMDDAGRNAVGYTAIPVSALSLTSLKDVLSSLLQAAFLIREHLTEVAFEAVQPEYTTTVLLEPSASQGVC